MATKKPAPKPATKPAPKGLPPASVRAGGSQGKLTVKSRPPAGAGTLAAWNKGSRQMQNAVTGWGTLRPGGTPKPPTPKPAKSPSILDQLAQELSKRFSAMTGPGAMTQGVDAYRKSIANKYGPNKGR